MSVIVCFNGVNVYFFGFFTENITGQYIVLTENFAFFAMHVNIAVTILRKRRKRQMSGNAAREFHIDDLAVNDVVIATPNAAPVRACFERVQ